jgi:hypothetical protein
MDRRLREKMMAAEILSPGQKSRKLLDSVETENLKGWDLAFITTLKERIENGDDLDDLTPRDRRELDRISQS